MKTLLPLLLVCTAPVFASSIHLGNYDSHCDEQLISGIRLDSKGVFLTTEANSSWQIHDGTVVHSGKTVSVSSDQQANLRQYETGLRQLVPQVADIANSGLDIGTKAARVAFTTLLGEKNKSSVRIDAKFAELRKHLHERVNSTELKVHVFGEDGDDDVFNEDGLALASTVLGASVDVLGQAIHAAFDEEYAKQFKARTDSLDAAIDAQIGAQAKQLEQQTEQLCTALKSLTQQSQNLVKGNAQLAGIEVTRHKVHKE